MTRDPIVAELVDRLVEARCAELVHENRVLKARLARELARREAPAPRAAHRPRPVARPRLRLVTGEPA